MRLNDRFTEPTIVHANELDWVPSPSPGVDRRMLFRIGGEVARATSIVRYAPGSAFPRHTHTGGEEILVLSGTFQDEHGDYPAGTYFRNPPGTSHVPAAADGCEIFVRLWQYREGDSEQIVRQPGEGKTVTPKGGAAEARSLFDDGHEQVRIERFEPGAVAAIENSRGLEILVIDGEFRSGEEVYGAQTWLRLPAGIAFNATAGAAGARIWLKDAPLIHADVLKLPEQKA